MVVAVVPTYAKPIAALSQSATSSKLPELYLEKINIPSHALLISDQLEKGRVRLSPFLGTNVAN
jgi:hypothetical protein